MIDYIITGIVGIAVIMVSMVAIFINKRTYKCGHNDDLDYVCPVCDLILPDDATEEHDTFYCCGCGTKLRKAD